MLSSANPDYLIEQLKEFLKQGTTDLNYPPIAQIVEILQDSRSPAEILNLLWNEPSFAWACRLTPKEKIKSRVIQDFLMQRKIWNVTSDHYFIRMRSFMELRFLDHDGGMCLESLSLLSQSLNNFANNSGTHQDLVRKIGEVFTAGFNNEISRTTPLVKKFGRGYAQLVYTGAQGHLIAGMLIKTDFPQAEYQLILSDHDSNTPLKIINIPADKVNTVLSGLKSIKESSARESNKYLNETIPALVQHNYEKISFIKRGSYSYGRCYIENYLPLILFLMTMHAGVEEGQLLFKKFKLFMWESTLEEFKQHFNDRITPGISKYIKSCENIISHKKSVIEFLEQNLTPKEHKKKSFTEHCKDAYKKVFYTAGDSAEERIYSFFGFPQVKYEYDPVAKKTVHTDDMDDVFKWGGFILLAGFIYHPLKNLVKLLVEFLPYCLQKAAKHGAENLRQRKAEDKHPSPLNNIAISTGIFLLNAGYYIAKAFRVAVRIVTSPLISAKQGWKIHPALGVASVVASVIAISALMFFTIPIFAYTNSIWAAKLGLTAIANFYTAVSAAFLSFEGILTAISVTQLALWASTAFEAIGRGLLFLFRLGEHPQEQLTTMRKQMPFLTAEGEQPPPSQNTLAMAKALNPVVNASTFTSSDTNSKAANDTKADAVIENKILDDTSLAIVRSNLTKRFCQSSTPRVNLIKLTRGA